MGRARDDKPFDQACHDKYDWMSKEATKELLTQLGFQNVGENYGEANGDFREIYDVHGEHPEWGCWKIGCEIKKDWGTKWREWPYRWHTMDFPYRRRNSTGTHMFMVGFDMERLFLVKTEVMKQSPVSSKPCRNRSCLERFYNVWLPAPTGSFWFKEGGRWKLYKPASRPPEPTPVTAIPDWI